MEQLHRLLVLGLLRLIRISADSTDGSAGLQALEQCNLQSGNFVVAVYSLVLRLPVAAAGSLQWAQANPNGLTLTWQAFIMCHVMSRHVMMLQTWIPPAGPFRSKMLGR